MECKCVWSIEDDGDKVVSFCGAHAALNNKILWPIEAKLKAIEEYAATQHPLISSRACPLCTWEWKEAEGVPGWATGKRTKECSFHHALNQLYALKIEDA